MKSLEPVENQHGVEYLEPVDGGRQCRGSGHVSEFSDGAGSEYFRCEACSKLCLASEMNAAQERCLSCEMPAMPSPGLSGVQILGLMALLSGLAGLVFFLQMDTSILTEREYIAGRLIGGARVHNLSLASQREAGLIASGVVAVIGTLLIMLAGRGRD